MKRVLKHTIFCLTLTALAALALTVPASAGPDPGEFEAGGTSPALPALINDDDLFPTTDNDLPLTIDPTVLLDPAGANAGGSPNFHLIQRFSLGDPSGTPNGNPFFTGSTMTYLNKLEQVLGGSVFRRHLYAPEQAAVWGPGGAFGGELYLLSVVTGLPKDSLLFEHQRVLFQFATLAATQSDCTASGGTMEGDWCLFSTNNFYYPMQAYTHFTGCGARTYRRLHFGEATGLGYPGTGCSETGSDAPDLTRTFASFRSLAGDYSCAVVPTNCGAMNMPPDLSDMCGFAMRYEVAYQLITGDWVLTNPTVDTSGGFTKGTAYTDGGGGVTVQNLGARSAESKVKC